MAKKVIITKESLESLLNQGFSTKQIAKEFKVSVSTIRARIKKFNLGFPSRNKRPSKEFLEDILFVRMWSMNKISNHLGINRETVYQYLDYYQLPTPNKYLKLKFGYEIVKDYLEFNSIKKIAKKYRNIGKVKVRSILTEMGVDVSLCFGANMLKMRMGSWAPISNRLANIISGEMLGDGNISLNGRNKGELPFDSDYLSAIDTLHLISHIRDFSSPNNSLETIVQDFNKSRNILVGFQTARFRICKHILETAWVMYISQIFRSEGYPCLIGSRTSMRDGQPYKIIELESSSSLQLERERQLWYTNGTKHLPHEIIENSLNSSLILHLYIGDGSCSGEVYFHTQNFSLAEVKLLRDAFEKELVSTVKIKASHVKPDLYSIVIPQRCHKDLFDYLDSDKEIKSSLKLARQLFPWKFDRKLRKKDVIDYKKEYIDEEYFQTYVDILNQIMGEKHSILAREIFPWKFNS